MPSILDTLDALTTAQQADLTLYSRLRPFIFGPKALLHRFANASEKITALVGSYNPSVPQTYSWPNKKAGSIVDLSFVKVWIADAILNYFTDLIGSGSTIAPVASFTNRIRSNSVVFKTANGFSRNAAFGDRDVQIGDPVLIRGVVSAVQYTLWSTVSDFAPEMTAAVVGAATTDANNKSTQIEAASIVQVGGTPLNDIVAVADGTLYESLADGFINRTYTITCIQGSIGEDATTALLSVVSADGLDNQASISPAAFASPTAIGTKGLKVTFSLSLGSHSTSGDPEDDFIVGQQWTASVSEAFTKPVPTSGGTYAGATNTTYVVTVTRGGLYSGSTKPQITVSTTTGSDSSGPTNVSATATNVAIGTQGTLIKFSQAGLRKGDVYYVPVTASAPAAIQTLILNNDLGPNLSLATDLDLFMYEEVAALEIPAKTTVPAPATYWTDDQSGLVLAAGITATAADLTNGGSQVYVPIGTGNGYSQVYVEYREWDISQAGTIYDISDRADVESVLGTVDPDNPIAFAVDLALQNTAGSVIGPTATKALTTTNVVRCSVLGGDPDDPTVWQVVLDSVLDEPNIYNLVPLTTDPTVQAATAAHVIAQSTVDVPNYRACLLAASVISPAPIVDPDTSSDHGTVLATIAQNPSVIATSYTLLSVPAGNSNFITNGVEPGDTVRYFYGVDAFGNDIWTEFTVSSVVSESSLLLVAGPGSPQSTAIRLEVWRTLSAAQVTADVEASATGFGNSRVCLVWPDSALIGGVEVPGYHVCAAVAGLIGSVPSHQGVRNVQILGFDSFPRSRSFLRTGQLDDMGSHRVFVCSTAPDGTNYVRWAVTTGDPADINAREEMFRRNLDMFVLDLLGDVWGQFIGAANAVTDVAAILRAALINFVNRLGRTTSVTNLGPAVISVVINSLAVDPVQADQINANLTFTGPYPNNKIILVVLV